MLERVATLEELDRHWCLEDVLDANEALDVYVDTNDADAIPPGAADGRITLVVSTKGKR